MPRGRPRNTEGAAPATARQKQNGANLGFEAIAVAIASTCSADGASRTSGVGALAAEIHGVPVEQVILRGADGFEAVIITHGAAIHALKVPDRAGRSEDILLGNDNLAGYLALRRYLERRAGPARPRGTRTARTRVAGALGAKAPMAAATL